MQNKLSFFVESDGLLQCVWLGNGSIFADEMEFETPILRPQPAIINWAIAQEIADAIIASAIIVAGQPSD